MRALASVHLHRQVAPELARQKALCLAQSGGFLAGASVIGALNRMGPRGSRCARANLRPKKPPFWFCVLHLTRSAAIERRPSTSPLFPRLHIVASSAAKLFLSSMAV